MVTVLQAIFLDVSCRFKCFVLTKIIPNDPFGSN